MPDPIIGRRLFTDRVERDVFRDPLAGTQYVLADDGQRVYGAWIDEGEDADAVPIIRPVA